MTHIVSQTKKVIACSEQEKEVFYQLLCQCFLGVTWHDFMRDFQEKDAVMILRKEHSEGEIVGWSTLMVLTLTLLDTEVKAIFSGDTAVLPAYRSSTGLGVELSRYFLQMREQFPQHTVYYILISKGWRTYKIMPFFFKEFSPRYDKLRLSLRQSRYGCLWQEEVSASLQPSYGRCDFQLSKAEN